MSAAKTSGNPDTANEPGRLERRWGRDLINAGWLGLPSVFLQRQNAFAFDALDLNIVLQIADHWWEPDNHPYPSKKSLAERIGVDARTIQRRIARMERDGLIERVPRRSAHGGNKTNVYRLTPLIEKAKPFARELLAERHARTQEKEARRKRKRARVTLVRSN